uniref:VWFC domain-containing protein n=1 Tax=Octopus bimaculoides TaxID=37653 RepID=A0A0L8FXV8_OCTBM
MWTNPKNNCSKCECIGGITKCHPICKSPSCKNDETLFYLETDPCCPVCRKKEGK